MDPVFADGRPDTGPRDWGDLYRAFQAFVATNAAARRARGNAQRTPRPTPAPGAALVPHECNARQCVIYSWGDFHVCAVTGDVHYCRDVHTCPRRRTEDGYVVCCVSGAARQEDRLIVFGHVLGYAGSSAAITVGEPRDGGGGGGSRKRRRPNDPPAGPVVNEADGEATASRARLYNRARYCGALAGVSGLIPTHIRDAIMTAGEFNVDVLADANAAAQSAGLAVATGRPASSRAAAASSASSRAVDRQTREVQQDTENESDLTWLCEAFVRKDTEAVVARQESATGIKWRKAANEHICDCIRAVQPVYLMPLLSYVTKLITDSDRWVRAYRAIPPRAVAVIREWLAARVRALWHWFRDQVRRRNRSPLKYHFGYHALVVFYCSQRGIEWDHQSDGPRAASAQPPPTPTPTTPQLSQSSPTPVPVLPLPLPARGAETRWLLPPIPHLNVLLPSEKELSNHSLGRNGQRARIKKGMFTHTQKMTRNWLYTLTRYGECATAAIDAPFAARLREIEQQHAQQEQEQTTASQ